MPGIGAQARVMLLAPWQWRRNDGSLWTWRLYGAVSVFLLGAPAVAALVWMEPRPAWAAVGVLAFIGLTLAWGMQFGALLRLDHPHAAHSVPGHPRALRATALGLWLAIVALCGLCALLGASLLLDNGLGFALAVVLGSAAALTLVAAAMRWWAIWLLLSVAGAFGGVAAWQAVVIGVWKGFHAHWQVQPLSMTLMLLLAQGLLLCSLFGAGGAGHARAYASRERQRKSMAASAAGDKPTLAAYGRWGEWLSLPVQRVADVWLAHVCRHAKATPRSVMARAEVVLHGNQHWLGQVIALVVVQALVLLGFLLAMRMSGADMSVLLEGGRVGISIGLTSMAISASVSLRGALWRSRREQALLMLLPGMPQGVALNHAVAWRLMRHGLWTWVALLPAVAVMLWAGEGTHLLAFLAMALPMSALLWFDVSRLRAARPTAALGPAMLCYLAGGLSLLLLKWQPVALLPWALGVLLLSAALLTWRWRHLARLPQALPAGRLA
jgi:hypothetical protein